mmetsp:Transcript_17848/g.49949  ORF Transcript_17848/g.49949 Transcript_17848/m.49949 type:complete len:204 (-) Transcript_17848:970-1581(-)
MDSPEGGIMSRHPGDPEPSSSTDLGCTGTTQRLRFTVAYDGTAYRGFQLQLGHKIKDGENWLPAPTVQGELEATAGRVLRVPDPQRVVVVGASRTDSGVHSRGQVCHLDLQKDPEALPFDTQGFTVKMNMNLPRDVVIRDVAVVEPGFHAKTSARGWSSWCRARQDVVGQTRAAYGCAPSAVGSLAHLRMPWARGRVCVWRVV